MAYAPGPSTSRRRPVPPPPLPRNPSTATIRQRPQVQIPPGARPPINPYSPTALADSLHNTHLDPPAVPPRSSWSATQTTVPYAEPNSSWNGASPLQRPWTHGPQSPSSRPWENSAFVVGSRISLDDFEDSGYGGSSQGHQAHDDERTPTSTSSKRERRAMRVTRSEDSRVARHQDSWEKRRWGMDSSESFEFETASNAEQIGSGILADQIAAAETTHDKLTLFQKAEIPGFDEWAAVVPPEVREILDKREVQRQSNIYELIKTERNYIIGLQIFLYIFRDGLLYANPPIIPNREKLRSFIEDVFFNAQEILSIHLVLRDKLYERQRDQHPIYHTVADIYLKWLLEHSEPYTRFQKHLPRAVNCHKAEFRNNSAYRDFFNNVEKILSDLKTAGMEDPSVPRLEDPSKPTLEFLAASIKKKEFDAFLDAFNNRFPRIKLQFTTMQKHTPEDHSDIHGDGAPIPLIGAAIDQILTAASLELETLQKKVEYENFCKKLHFRKGEIIDLDWYNERRRLFKEGGLARRNRREVEWHGWSDLHVGLLDNYLVVTKEVAHRDGCGEQYNVVSRPIPMDYLCLTRSIDGPAETRRPEGCIIRDKLLGDKEEWWPFSLYHAADPAQRRYTFYAATQRERDQWINKIQEAKTIRDVYQNENKFFAINPLSGRRFNSKTVLVTANMAAKMEFTGPVLAAAPFSYDGEHFLVVSTQSGVYMGHRNNAQGIQKVLRFTDVSYMATLQKFDKIVLLTNEVLFAFSFQSFVRVWRREADLAELAGSGERVSRHRDSAVQFFRAGVCDGRMLGKSFIRCSMNLHVVEALHEPSPSPTVPRGGLRAKLSSSARETRSHSFRQFGQTLSLPRDATDIIMLNKRIVVTCQSQVVILDPRDPAMKAYPVPDFLVNPSVEYGSADAIDSLKDRCSKSQSLGMVLSRSKELMVVFADFGCYVTKYGAPARQSAYVRWETRATSVAFRWPHVLLFSPNYIEIRNVESGGLVQVVKGKDIKLLYSGPPYQGPILATMRGEDDAVGKTDSVVELLETAPIEIEQGQPADDAMWREWDI
ncbi:Rho guanine nucleotide exchange factor [Ceratobasidium sp. AG-Ba]|nr:Rho guanine nucleotide exchange factor [Ceratobasidium sp. AG-Ba]